ncbi:MAG: hypothetical protein ABIP48_22840 [Planctomycetota bacterium]
MSEKNGGAAVAEKLSFETLTEVGVNKTTLLQELAAGNDTADVALRYLSSLDSKSVGALKCKVSRKGAVSVYGLQQMPVTLYVGQWERLLKGAPDNHFVLSFIKEWEGKDFQGESATERGGAKEKYTAQIVRK